MAHISDYGNWMGHSQSKGKKPAERRGVAAEYDNDDDYENVSLENCPKPPPLPRGKKAKAAVLNQKDKGGAGPAATPGRPPKTDLAISVISGDPALRPSKLGLDLSSAAVAAAFQPPGGDLPLPKPASRRGCPGRSLLITYVLLGVCFLMCSVFLILALMKRPEVQQESEELNFHLFQRAANVSQNLADWEKIRAEVAALQKTVDAVHRSVSGELASVKQFSSKMQERITALQKRVDSVCGHCPWGWGWFQRTCYHFSESTKTWHEAKQFCLDAGAQLVIINTKEEQAFLVKARTTSRVYWLGLSDQKKENQWLWVDGSPLNLSFWSTGEPNDSGNEDCGTMATDGRWNDINCYMTDYWICEKAWLC
ncbi:C-type lectin domain family 4 member G isoform X1 [Caretta caretta]|uniref:C-type lectin domain family 4 member G isoform X1 n=1 Tax=Caretta caretta TaxID=8467 RepID=UPI0020942876|nr:C-type lectin domain family 17, member A-like isoform X1 [Caretta caretta]